MSKERTLKKLIEEFEASSGEFSKWHRCLTDKEKMLFKGWLQDMRAPNPKTN